MVSKEEKEFQNAYTEELIKLGQRIKKVRKHRKLTQGQLEELSKIDNSTVSKYERGKENIGYMVLFRIAKALQVSVKDLTDFNGPLPDPENKNFTNQFPKNSRKRH